MSAYSRFTVCFVGALLPAQAFAQALTMEAAVALALHRNQAAIAAKLDMQEAEYDRVEARVYPNPVLGYSLGNLVVGRGNPQGDAALSPGFFSQPVHSVSISDVIDVWGKRSARIRVASQSVETKTWLAKDALREVVFAVRSAFADVVREQSERELSRETRKRYDETVRLSRSRFAAGDISDAELRKVELEGLHYQNAEVDAQLELDLARQKLAELLALPSEDALPTLAESEVPRAEYAISALVQRALLERPDVRAAKLGPTRASAELDQARHVSFPDITLGVSYSHSQFTVSGDNPNTLGAAISVPLPIFDRNQAAIGRAEVETRQAQNELSRVSLEVRNDVADTYKRLSRARQLLSVFEGGMLERAESALDVAEKSYRVGGISLLELLEAQRTYLETRADYLRIVYDHRQALIGMMHAVGGDLP